MNSVVKGKLYRYYLTNLLVVALEGDGRKCCKSTTCSFAHDYMNVKMPGCDKLVYVGMVIECPSTVWEMFQIVDNFCLGCSSKFTEVKEEEHEMDY